MLYRLVLQYIGAERDFTGNHKQDRAGLLLEQSILDHILVFQEESDPLVPMLLTSEVERRVSTDVLGKQKFRAS